MKRIALTFSVLALAAAPAFAQEAGGPNAGGYVSVFAGPVWSAGNSTGSVLFEGGARIAPHLMVFGNVGHYANLQGDFDSTVDAAATTLADDGLDVTAGGSLPAWYGVGGLRAEIAARKHLMPYVLGGIGAAHLDPQAQITFNGGTLPDGSSPPVGTDVTSALMVSGTYTAPAASTAFMFTLGGGVQIPLVPHWMVDAGYRYARIAADTSLSATPLNTSAMTFGFGYRF
ncbi:MAG TPA: outer membrane beta-barrel protein [Vicinamibacterales bacterium]